METPDDRAQRLTPIVAALTAGVNALFDQVAAQPDLKLGAVEGALQQVSRTVFGAVLGATLELRRPAVEAAARCPRCGAVPQDKGVPRRVQETVVGPATWWRRYGWCGHCQQGWYPLDGAWGIVSGQFSDRVQATICRLGASLPFAAAAETLTAVSGITLGARTVERLTEARGQALEAVGDAAWADLCDGYRPVPPIPLRPSCASTTAGTRPRPGWSAGCQRTGRATRES